MAEIAGATITFTDYSAPGTPRFLNIPDSAGDVTVNDIWDTLSAEAAKLDNLIYKKLLERPGFGGKGELSPTKAIGISMKLNNIKVKFEDLAVPTIKRVVDGNMIAQDHNGDAMEPMENSDFVNWKTEADTSAAIVGVSSVEGYMRALGSDDADGESAAQSLRDMSNLKIDGTVDDSIFSPTTTEFEATAFTQASDDQLNSLVLRWTSGANRWGAFDISAYVHQAGTRARFTVSVPMPNAPSNGDTFILV